MIVNSIIYYVNYKYIQYLYSFEHNTSRTKPWLTLAEIDLYDSLQAE